MLLSVLEITKLLFHSLSYTGNKEPNAAEDQFMDGRAANAESGLEQQNEVLFWLVLLIILYYYPVLGDYLFA